MLNGYAPIFSQFGNNIYYSDVVVQAISCITSELKKINLKHIRTDGTDMLPVDSDLQKLLKEPNERMTSCDFIEMAVWNLFTNYNSFIIPTFEKTIDNSGNISKKYTGLYPISPSEVSIYNEDGQYFYYFRFKNGYQCFLKFEDVIHLKYRCSLNEFMGGNLVGQPDHKAMLKTLELNNILLQGIGKALKSSFAINGIVKFNSMLDDGKTDKAIKELEQRIKNNESGFLPIDLKGDFIPLQNRIQLVDEATLKFIDSKILRNFGVSVAILTGDYTKEQYEAFYQKSLEPVITIINQEFTKKLFTSREKSFGNEVKCYPHELIFMNNSEKLELFNMLTDTASCYKNTLLSSFGLFPRPEFVGQLAISSNKNNAINNDENQNSTPDNSSIKNEPKKGDDEYE